MQVILLEEANLGRVADPTAGAGGFEALTEALAGRAWADFQEIEREGGIVASLERDSLQGRIATVRAERERSIAVRKEPITGTSEFPNLAEQPVAVLLPSPTLAERDEMSAPPRPREEIPTASANAEQGTSSSSSVAPFASLVAAAVAGASLADLSSAAPGPDIITAAPLPSRRDAEGYERLRDVSDAQLSRTGARPRAFLANLGPIAAFAARATFAKGFFEAGGIEAPANDGFTSLDELVAAFRASGAPIACLCSSDEIYGTDAVAAVESLAASGARRLYLAGRAAEGLEHALQGRVGFVHQGCDVLDILTEAQGAATGEQGRTTNGSSSS